MEHADTKASEIVNTRDELRMAVLAIVNVLREVDGGDLSATVELSHPKTEPLGALASCVNLITRALATRREATIAYQRELELQIETIEKQRLAIRELSTPIIEIWSGVLCAPIIGVLDSARAAEMSNALLNAVIEREAAYIIIDITGIEVMDTRATDHFLRMAKAVRLLGAECVLSGISPIIAHTITHMDAQLEGIETHRSLRNALQHYVELRRSTSRKLMRRAHGAK